MKRWIVSARKQYPVVQLNSRQDWDKFKSSSSRRIKYEIYLGQDLLNDIARSKGYDLDDYLYYLRQSGANFIDLKNQISKARSAYHHNVDRSMKDQAQDAMYEIASEIMSCRLKGVTTKVGQDYVTCYYKHPSWNYEYNERGWEVGYIVPAKYEKDYTYNYGELEKFIESIPAVDYILTDDTKDYYKILVYWNKYSDDFEATYQPNFVKIGRR